MAAIQNFALSTIGLILNHNATTPVYSKVVDSVSASTTDTELDNIATIEVKSTAISDSFATAYATRATYTAAQTYSAPSGNYITVGGRNVYLEYKEPVGSTLIVPNSHAAYFGRLLYGHNIPGVFAYLNNISEGETITVSINGAAQTYRVVARERKAIGEISMASLVYTRSYAFTMMTCVGDGSTHRDIIYLN
ncbi:hypothetical protein IKF76_00845 [Candidatus Saccharibacteria bacterium]|nr:hypothetical protein [Candidatus Saccharibacteria bacterium]